MQRSDFLIKLMSVILFMAIAAYVGLYIYNRAESRLETCLAVRYVAEEKAPAEGYIVRREQVLPGGEGSAALMVDDGEKVASGQAVAVYYEGSGAIERASEIRRLQIEIKNAEERAAAAAMKKPGAEEAVLALASAVQRGEFERLEELARSVKGMVFSGGEEHQGETDVASLRRRLDELLAETDGTKTVCAPASGVFTSAVDGNEEVSPEDLQGATPSALRGMFRQGQDSKALGKIISGTTWYYAAIMDETSAENLGGKATATLQFDKTFGRKLEMKVESVGAEEDGKCVVVFSAKTCLSETSSLRELKADVILRSVSGLSVPKRAVCREDGGDYVYLLTGLQAEKVPVEILCDRGDEYVVRDGAENGTALREGSEIIVGTQGLYDGKVIDR